LSMAPRHTTHMDVGNADFAWSKNLPSTPGHMRSLASMPPRYTVHPEHKAQVSIATAWAKNIIAML